MSPRQAFAKLGILESTAGLSRRERESAYYHHALRAPAEDGVEVVRDLAKTLPWQVGHATTTLCPCLTSGARPWWVYAGRRMVGIEALMLQGFDLQDLVGVDGLSNFEDIVLLSLAGNAMHGHVLCDVLLAMFVVGRPALEHHDVEGTVVASTAEDDGQGDMVAKVGEHEEEEMGVDEEDAAAVSAPNSSDSEENSHGVGDSPLESDTGL